MKSAILLALLGTGCRFGFDAGLDGSASDARDAPVDGPPAPLAAGSDLAIGFQMGGSETAPNVAWDGADFLVGWLDSRGRAADPSIAGTVVSPAGAVVTAASLWAFNGFIVGDRASIACAPDGTCVLLVGNYGSSGGLWRVIMRNGAATGDATYLVNRNSHDPAIATVGTHFVAVYNDGIIANPAAMQTVLVDETGTPTTSPADLEKDALGAQLPRVAASASACLATWTNQGQELRFSLIAGDGSVVTPGGQRTGAVPIATPDVAASPHDFLLVWVEAGSTVRAALVDPSGTAQPAFTIAAGTAPVVAWDGTAYLVAYVDGSGALAVIPVYADGTLAPALPLATGPVSEPAIASNGAGTSVIAYAQSGIRAAQVHR